MTTLTIKEFRKANRLVRDYLRLSPPARDEATRQIIAAYQQYLSPTKFSPAAMKRYEAEALKLLAGYQAPESKQ